MIAVQVVTEISGEVHVVHENVAHDVTIKKTNARKCSTYIILTHHLPTISIHVQFLLKLLIFSTIFGSVVFLAIFFIVPIYIVIFNLYFVFLYSDVIFLLLFPSACNTQFPRLRMNKVLIKSYLIKL